MSTMFLRSLLSAGVLAALFAAPAQAAPELITPLNPCYLVAQENQRQLVCVAAKGFTPFNDVDIFIDDILQIDTKVARRTATINGHVLAPFQEEGTGPFTLRLSERQRPDERGRRRRRWSRDWRSSSRHGGRRRRRRSASRGAASWTPACPSTRTTCSRARCASRSGSGSPRARAERSTSSASSSRSRRARAGASGRSSSISTRSYGPKAAVRVPTGALQGPRLHEPGLPVYAHYVFAGKVRRSVRLGLPKGPCGTFNFEAQAIPSRRARAGARGRSSSISTRSTTRRLQCGCR